MSKKSPEQQKLDADFVYKITSLVMQQIRAYEIQIGELTKQRNELQEKLNILQNTPSDEITITVH